MFRMVLRLSRLAIVAAITLVALICLASNAPSKVAKQAAIAAVPQLPADPLMVNPVVWSSLATPIYPVKGTDDRIHLIYGLNVTNASRHDVRLTKLEVLDERENPVTGTSKVVSSDGQDLTGKLRPFSLPQPTQDAADFTDQLSPGQSGIIYFDVVYRELHSVPNSLKHRVTTSFQDPNQALQTYTAIDPGTEVSRQEAVVIAPPLKGNNWLIANGSGTIISPHRYTVQATNGRLRPPEYFAIDFVRLDTQKRLYTGDIANVKNWFSYGSDILSVAPGRVIEVRDDLRDLIPGQPLPVLKADEYPGNHVIVDIGNGKYAGYAHMLPGSIVVREGDTVQQGQVLGKLGNTGNSDGPHLHFQITDSASFLNTNGLPFVFDRMTYQGQVTGTLDSVGNTVFSGQTPTINAKDSGHRTSQMPLTLDLIEFR